MNDEQNIKMKDAAEMFEKVFSLSGEVAVITGAGSGIGEGIAKVLAKAGAKVICAARSTSQITRVAEEITLDGGIAEAIMTDVTKRKEVEFLAESAVDKFGKLDIWVNNAGGSPVQAPLADLEIDEWDRTLALNLTSIYHSVQATVKRMASGGRIINISSLASQDVYEGSGHYSAAKAGVNMLTKTLAHELGPNIRVNAILPGFVPTKVMMEALKIEDSDLPDLLNTLQLPAGRLGSPDDMGIAVLYLASKGATWVTGQCLRVAGTS